MKIFARPSPCNFITDLFPSSHKMQITNITYQKLAAAGSSVCIKIPTPNLIGVHSKGMAKGAEGTYPLSP